MKQTPARAGEKTRLDALVPAVDAVHAAAETGIQIPAALENAATAARSAAESTRLHVARHGRAEYSGEKTLGHADAGTVSIALIFDGFSKACAPREETSDGRQ